MISAISTANIAVCASENYAGAGGGSPLHAVWMLGLAIAVMQFWWGMQKLRKVRFDRFWKALVLVLPDVLLLWCISLLCQKPAIALPANLCSCDYVMMTRMHLLYLLLGWTFLLTFIEYSMLLGSKDPANKLRLVGVASFFSLAALSWPQAGNSFSHLPLRVHLVVGLVFVFAFLAISFCDRPAQTSG